MRSNSFMLVIVLICILIISCAGIIRAKEKPQADPASVTQVVEGNNQFAWKLYEKLSKEKQGKNIFFSPTSISTALAMTYAGAKGETAKEMAKVIYYYNHSDYYVRTILKIADRFL